MRRDQHTNGGEASSSFFIQVPSNLPVPILNRRWASESSSALFGPDGDADGRAGSGNNNAAGGTGAHSGQAGNNNNVVNAGGARQPGVDGKAVSDGDDGGGMTGGDGQGTTQRASPWSRAPPPPPPVFDEGIPRPRFIAKIMQWYQCVEAWCEERPHVHSDRDRFVVAPPPRPPLFVEGSALFALPAAARLSPYNVNEWAVCCHRWWEHVHRHFHNIQAQMLGQSVVADKGASMMRPVAELASLVEQFAYCDASRDDELARDDRGGVYM